MKGKFDYGIPDKVVENSPHMMRYWKDHASYPFQSHDLWFITEDTRWGKYESGFDAKSLIKKVNREDLWRDAAKSLGLRPPISRPRHRAVRRNSSTEGFSIPENPRSGRDGDGSACVVLAPSSLSCRDTVRATGSSRRARPC
jgi:nitrate/nitrite transport system substrate-binding protein